MRHASLVCSRRMPLLVMALGLLPALVSGTVVASDDPVVPPVLKLANRGADDQDDLCVWVHPEQPELSTVIASDKAAGKLFVYDLQGELLQEIPAEKPGNIDIRSGFDLGGRPVALVVVVIRSGGPRLQAFRVDPETRQLSRVDAGISTGPNYGGCLYQSRRDGRLYFIATSEDGVVGQYALRDDGRGRVAGALVRSWPLGKCEAAVADDATGALYIGEESRGIWKLGAEPDAAAPGELIVKIGDHGIAGDIEGLALVPTGGDTGFLVMSDQGASRFHVFRREDGHKHVGTFRIQSAEESDGIDAVPVPLGDRFPQGVFVCHSAGESPCPLLLVSWGDVVSHLRVNPN